MVPSLTYLNSCPETEGQNELPTVYFMDTFVVEAVRVAQRHFKVILPGDPEHRKWREAKYLLIRSSYLTEADIASCPNLLAIGKQGVGTDKIDTAACAKRGIKVFNTPGVNARAVAELVLALTTSLARQIRPISLRLMAGELVPKESCSGLILHCCKIGVLGMGNIGKMVAKMFLGAFDSSIIAYDPYMHTDAWPDLKHKRATTVEEVLKDADVITVHVPLTSETQDLISYQQLALMKPKAILINTARGGIVNEEALCRALTEGLIWGAGLDCHVKEPPTKEQYESLWMHPNVISMPHVGAATAQTQIDTAVAAVSRLHEYVSRTSVVAS